MLTLQSKLSRECRRSLLSSTTLKWWVDILNRTNCSGLTLFLQHRLWEILLYRKSYHGPFCICLLQTEHPFKSKKMVWHKLLSKQRRRAVVACFRMTPLYNIPRWEGCQNWHVQNGLFTKWPQQMYENANTSCFLVCFVFRIAGTELQTCSSRDTNATGFTLRVTHLKTGW